MSMVYSREDIHKIKTVLKEPPQRFNITEKYIHLCFQLGSIPVYATRLQQQGSQLCFATFLKVKNHKIANSSASTKARKISTNLESLKF